MKLYSYVVSHDTGFAPNPFWGFCTLACCKPVIRRVAAIGDWVVGLSPKRAGNKIVYAMQVQEVVTFEQYFQDERFKNKIPDYTQGPVIHKCGDNIYEPSGDGRFRQLPSTHGPEDQEHDLRGRNVLISKNFYYFGSEPIDLPFDFAGFTVGRGHKTFTDDTAERFEVFISHFEKGVHAAPDKWPPSDRSWSMQQP